MLPVDLDDGHVIAGVIRYKRLPAVAAAYQKMTAEGQTALMREGVRPEDMSFPRQADMRYVGQSYEIEVPIDPEGDGLLLVLRECCCRASAAATTRESSASRASRTAIGSLLGSLPADGGRDVVAVGERRSEVTVQRRREPLPVAHDQRVIQSEFGSLFRSCSIKMRCPNLRALRMSCVTTTVVTSSRSRTRKMS